MDEALDFIYFTQAAEMQFSSYKGNALKDLPLS